MREPFCYWAILGVALIFGGAAAHAVGLGVGVFGGWAVPTGDMADFEGFNLSSSPALSARAYVELREYLAFELGAGYQIDYPPQTKEYWFFPEFTEAFPVTGGAEVRTTKGSFRFSAAGGGGYYIINTKLVGNIDSGDTGFGNRPYATYVSVNGPGMYVGGGVSYLFKKFAFAFTPRFNYIFNEGTYEGTIAGEPAKKTSETKDWNDSYFEITAGVIYTLF
jgi:hypothetical protein